MPNFAPSFKSSLLTTAVVTSAVALSACGGGGGGSSSSGGSGSGNTAPVANAGVDQTVTEGATVTLSGSATDADGTTPTMTWSAPAGITLSSTTASAPTFTAPDVTADTNYTFTLTADDGTATDADTVVITVEDTAVVTPAASVEKQIVAPGGQVSLSVDNPTTGSYAWTQTGGTTVTLSDTTAEQPTFTVPAVTTSETLTFQVTYDPAVTETKTVFIYVPPAYDTGMENVGNFTDFDDWACSVKLSFSPSSSETISAGTRTITGNSVPDHAVGSFPNMGNPNTIAEVTTNYSVTTTPVKTSTATEMNEFGVLLNGIKLERDTAEAYPSGNWNYEAITQGIEIGDFNVLGSLSNDWIGTDCNNAHVQPTGQYHNHGLPEAYIQELIEDAGGTNGVPTQMVLAGYAADGFPLYLRYGHSNVNDSSSALVPMEHSWELISGTRPNGPGGSYDGTFRQDWEYVANSGNTDQCGGRTAVTPQSPTTPVYHYYITDDYPFIPRCVFGTPDSSFRGRR